MARIVCPHCKKRFSISHSAFVTGREGAITEEIARKNYRPDPQKHYKTSEKVRRVALGYYWKHKRAVLDREKRRRSLVKNVRVSVHD